MHKFLICLQDVAEFGSDNSVGQHVKLESSEECLAVVETMERDRVDRLFLYVSGWDDSSFNKYLVHDGLWGLHACGGYLAGGTYPVLTKLRTELAAVLSTKQHNRLPPHTSYSDWFKAVKGVSKSNKVHRLADIGLKYCQVLDPAFFTSLASTEDSHEDERDEHEKDDRCDYCGSANHASHECESRDYDDDESEDEADEYYSNKESDDVVQAPGGNVYSLADARAARGVRTHAAYKKSDTAYDFTEIMERNKRNSQRIAGERSGHNRAVTQKERLK